ncbi:small oligopeptide transporter [Fistulina hepatica ATCC 64428]|uniref:Small oligopeptide transporter n=1 Tax=Fistulina hepatica ATCC 64428 TaxID=1128425 RepID=A0A0D7AFM7_9AGAR|nr:small oligopeptide transporter [Fistulina hepatica ATCC 64428]
MALAGDLEKAPQPTSVAVYAQGVFDPNFDEEWRYPKADEFRYALGRAYVGPPLSTDKHAPRYDSRSSVFRHDSDSFLEDDSPYPEVRSAVANFDDPDMPCSTPRAWVLGMIFAILIAGTNQFFYLRYPTVQITQVVAQLVIFPLGRAWARIIPVWQLRIVLQLPVPLNLNPGPFNIKEHVLSTIMASVGAPAAYATDIVAVQKIFYFQHWSFTYRWLLIISSQLIGFSMGGVARRFLVSPPSMIWPNALVSCALFNTLHSQEYAGIGSRDGISRERYFTYAFFAAFVWYFFPGYLFQALSTFSWVCWIRPRDIKINQLFGYRSGLGFSIFTFDWNQIAYIGSPLATPWWAEVNVMIGFFIFFWVLTPILYYSNVWFSQYMPISSTSAYDNTGNLYNLTRILKPDATLDVEKYEQYSPLLYSTVFLVAYGTSFLAVTSTITHALIHFIKPIRIHFRRTLQEHPDVHARLMARYPDVPQWYYWCTFVLTFVGACVAVSCWPTGLTIWSLVLALFISLMYLVPIGMIQAVTNRQVGLNVITELIAGFILPGKPVAMMIFKTFGYTTMSQAMQFTVDFKLGHYMKIPPRPMFWCQVFATIAAGTVQLGVQALMFEYIPDLCTTNQKDSFTCASTQVFGTSSIIWGLIGPSRLFTKGHIYYGLLYFFLVGSLSPVILWWLGRRYKIIQYLNFPLIVTGIGSIPPATALNYVGWAVIGFLFQYVVRRRWFPYWAKYNYVLSAALDSGTAVGVVIVYFCLQYPNVGADTIGNWWGNTVFEHTADWEKAPLRSVISGRTFGCVYFSFDDVFIH